MTFLVLSLPRSRSAWLARFLSYKDWNCGHDQARHMRQIEDARSWLSQPNTGSVETAVAPFWRLARHLSPDVRLVTVRRDPEEAAESAVRAGFAANIDDLIGPFSRLDHKLGQIAHRTGARSFRYADLEREEVCADLFEHLLPYKHDPARWRALDAENIQIDPQALNRYARAHQGQLDRFAGIAKQQSLSLLARKPIPEASGVIIDFEPLADLLRDGQTAMRAHCAEVGEHPDNFVTKNFTALQANEDVGALQVTTARSNGRVFGYLLTLIGESLEAKGRLWACHTAFYASPDYPGVGLKLQRKAAQGLAQRGVHEVVMRAGVRGAGERAGALYRRLGAEPFGTYYRLQLGEA